MLNPGVFPRSLLRVEVAVLDLARTFLFLPIRIIAVAAIILSLNAADAILEFSFCLWLLVRGVKDQKPALIDAG